MEIDAHDLAALMCSKLCHDLISPVGALGNGIEVLEDEDDGELKADAISLIAQSARSAAAKLQFARLAYGLSGGAGGSLDIADAARAAGDYLATTKAKLSWPAQADNLPKDIVRLALNLAVLGHEAIPRGGAIAVAVDARSPRARITVEAVGQAARLQPASLRALEGDMALADLDARLVQPFFTGLILRRLSGTIEIVQGDGKVTIEARAG